MSFTTTTTNTHDYKVGTTRNGDRVWLDACLKPFDNWCNGSRYDRHIDGNTITLTAAANGKYKVSGKSGRPVIDLCGKYLTAVMGGSVRCVVAIDSETITITPMGS